MKYDKNNIDIIFDIKATYGSISYMPDDFEILIKIQQNDKLIQQFFLPYCEPDQLFFTLKDVLDGKFQDIQLGPDCHKIKILRNNDDFEIIDIIIIPTSFKIPPSEYINVEKIDVFINKIFTKNDINQYNEWRFFKTMKPPCRNVLLELHPEDHFLTISKKKYKNAILDLFEKYSKLIEEYVPEYDKNQDYEKYFSMIKDK